MAATFIFRKNVDLSLELGVRCDRAWLATHLATLDVFTLGSTKEYTDVFTCLPFVEQLAEHFDSGNRGLDRRSWANSNDFNFLVDLDDSTLNPAGNNSTAASDGEDVFDWH